MTGFEQLADAWQEHVRASAHLSVGAPHLRHESFAGLVDLGEEAIPLCLERWADDESIPWGAVLARIVDEPSLDERDRQAWFAWARRRRGRQPPV
jgi:hypothetical protein